MIETERLLLRLIEERDTPALREQSDDPAVMQYLMPLPGAELDALIARLKAWHADHGATFWVVERKEDGAMLGLCGLKPGGPGTPIADMVEIGWRLGSGYFGQGYAREAAEAVLDWAWANTDAGEVVAITVEANAPSWGLMERLGMTRVADGDFDHPMVADGSPLKRHIQYRIARP
ncbi:GNAT family N-acetyltransferase [soil metagenome]